MLNRRILVVNLNPTFQRTIRLKSLQTGEVNRAISMRFDISGKGINTARVLHQLGCDVWHLTHLGDLPEGSRKTALDLLAKDGLNILWEPAPADIRTCITLLDESKGQTTEIIEPSEPVDHHTVTKVQRRFENELDRFDWLVLCGTRANGYPDKFFENMCRIARDKGVKVVADFRGPELVECLEVGIHLVKINLVEFVQTFLPDLAVSESNDTNAVETVKTKMIEVAKKYCDFVVTRGDREVLYTHNNLIASFSPSKISPVNTIGSGDAFMAGLVWQMSQGKDLPQSVQEGSRCGTLNAKLMKPGCIAE